MIASDEDALICDLAETYHIFNYRELPVKLLATLCVGLRDNSRIKLKINGERLPLETNIQMLLFDVVNLLKWELEGGKGDKPVLLYEQFNGKIDDGSDHESFRSGEDFMKKWKQLAKGG